MANQELIKFILEARKRKFTDTKITEALLSNGWPMHEINLGFQALREKHNFKNSVTIWLDKDIIKLLEKRAKKNMLTLPEQVEDILRRSVLNNKSNPKKEKLDDMLVGLFSRKTKNH